MTAVTTAFSIAIASATLTSLFSVTLPFDQLPFMRGCRRSTRATAATMRSVWVIFTPCDCSIAGISA